MLLITLILSHEKLLKTYYVIQYNISRLVDVTVPICTSSLGHIEVWI
jgi:hypothetical protein